MRGFQGVSLICYTAQEKPTINHSVPGVNSRSPDVGGWKHHTMGTKDQSYLTPWISPFKTHPLKRKIILL